MNCDKCKYYHWYCDWCAKRDCKVGGRAVCNCFKEAKPPKDSRKKRHLKHQRQDLDKEQNMNFTKEQIAELENLTKAIAEWLKKNADAHTSVTISTDRYDVKRDTIGSPF